MTSKFILSRILLYLIFSFVGFTNVFGQLPGDVSSQIQKLLPNSSQLSPNASAIQKYGDFSVNLYTGTPDISIPLFEIQSGAINVPIILSYHSSGTHYTDRASWAGLGW